MTFLVLHFINEYLYALDFTMESLFNQLKHITSSLISPHSYFFQRSSSRDIFKLPSPPIVLGFELVFLLESMSPEISTSLNALIIEHALCCPAQYVCFRAAQLPLLFLPFRHAENVVWSGIKHIWETALYSIPP